MVRTRLLFVLAAILGIAGMALVTRGAVAQTYRCDTNAKIPCKCVDVASSLVCVNSTQTVILIWCTTSGQSSCIARTSFNCPGGGAGGIAGIGDCSSGYRLDGSQPCSDTSETSC